MFGLRLLLSVPAAAQGLHDLQCKASDKSLCLVTSTRPGLSEDEAEAKKSNAGGRSCAYADWGEVVTPELWTRWRIPKDGDKVLFEDGNVTVTAHDHDCFRVLRVGTMIGSVARCPGGECQEQALLGEYAKAMVSLAAAFSPWMHHWALHEQSTSAFRVLVFGLGGGMLPSFLASKESPLLEQIGRIAAVEFDQRMVTAATEYMGLSPSVDVIIGDAFDLNAWHKGERYDVIFVDTCTCTSVEALAVAELRARVLDGNGVIILNYLDYLPQRNLDWEAFGVKVTQAFQSVFSDGVVLKLRLQHWINTIIVGLPHEPPPDFLALSSIVGKKARWPFDTEERIENVERLRSIREKPSGTQA